MHMEAVLPARETTIDDVDEGDDRDAELDDLPHDVWWHETVAWLETDLQ